MRILQQLEMLNWGLREKILVKLALMLLMGARHLAMLLNGEIDTDIGKSINGAPTHKGRKHSHCNKTDGIMAKVVKTMVDGLRWRYTG